MTKKLNGLSMMPSGSMTGRYLFINGDIHKVRRGLVASFPDLMFSLPSNLKGRVLIETRSREELTDQQYREVETFVKRNGGVLGVTES